jgi:glycosyltransferase involved in cell wall biosynthesis
VRKVARVLRDYDILYSHTAIGGQLLGDVSARLARRPHLIHQHTYPQFSSRPVDAALQRALCRTLLGRRRFIAVAPHVGQGLVACGVRSEGISVIPNGVPLPAESGSGSATPVRFGLLGRFDPGKGMIEFIDAARTAKLGSQEAHFVIGGSSGPFSDHEKEVRRRAGQAGVEIVEPGVSGTGFLQGIDVLVMPSLYEGSPLALLEAMSFGKAVIGTDIPGIRSIVGHDDVALLVPVGDGEALRAAILRLAGDPQLWKQAGTRARRLVEQRYTKDRMVSRCLSELDAAVSAR